MQPREKGCPLCRLGIRGESGSGVKVGSISGAVQKDSILSLPDAGKAASLASLWLCHRHPPVMPECVEKALWKTSRLACPTDVGTRQSSKEGTILQELLGGTVLWESG